MVIAETIVVRRGGWFQGAAPVDALITRSDRMTTDGGGGAAQNRPLRATL
jgi:hypothetical protein